MPLEPVGKLRIAFRLDCAIPEVDAYVLAAIVAFVPWVIAWLP